MPLFQNKYSDKDLRQQRGQIIKRTANSFKKLLNWPKSTALRSFHFQPDLFCRSANIISFNKKSQSRMEVILLKCFHWRSKNNEMQSQPMVFIQSEQQSWLYLIIPSIFSAVWLKYVCISIDLIVLWGLSWWHNKEKWQVALVKLDPWCALISCQVDGHRCATWYSFKYWFVRGGTGSVVVGTCWYLEVLGQY